MKLLIDIPEHIYEHAKETTEDSRDEFEAMRAIANGTQQESSSENPNTCGDAISRQAVLDLIEHYNSDGLGSVFYGYEQGVKFAGAVNKLPSVSPKQRTGQWIKQNYGWNWQCSECGFVTPPSAKEIFTFCPKCGEKKEVDS